MKVMDVLLRLHVGRKVLLVAFGENHHERMSDLRRAPKGTERKQDREEEDQ